MRRLTVFRLPRVTIHVILGVVVLTCAAGPVSADLLVLKVGNGTKEVPCVILDETETGYRVEMRMGKKAAKMSFPKSRVVRVERHTAEANAALRAKWSGGGVSPSGGATTGRTAATGIGPPPAELQLDPFYEKYMDAGGIPIVGSRKVPTAALFKAQRIVERMLAKRDDVRQALITGKVRVAIMAATEVTTDIPEHRSLGAAWNTRARGVGATPARPVCSGAAENLLGLRGDRYRGENILIHEFAHTIHTMGLNVVDPTFQARLNTAYRNAQRKQLWLKTYAGTNAIEYWAEGVQCWYNVNQQADPPNGVHNHVNTRKELRRYDPELADLIAEVFRGEG